MKQITKEQLSGAMLILTDNMTHKECCQEFEKCLDKLKDCKCAEWKERYDKLKGEYDGVWGEKELLQQQVEALKREKAEQQAIVFGVGDIICGNGVKHKQLTLKYICLYCEIDKLRKALEIVKEYLEDMASFECFCCNLPKLSSELLTKVEALNGKEEVCECDKMMDWKNGGYYHHTDMFGWVVCPWCGKNIKEVSKPSN